MADIDLADNPMPDAQPQRDNSPSEDEQSDESSEAEVPMVVSRARRSNAGNRMSKLLQLAEAEDSQNHGDYGEIFQEAADDVEFEADDGEEGDENLNSSSDEDEDEDAQDEEQGEKELKKAERATSNKRKRGERDLLHTSMKRAHAKLATREIQPPSPASASDTTGTRSRKKSERVSWLPVEEEGPKRASSRQLSVQNKQAVHERLKEKEKHRLRTVAIMKAAEMRKEASKPKILTQAERLAEAAATERMNSRSLNRWETAERKRAEEQAARLAALKNRKLEGPIISYWSGPSVWVNGKLKGIGKSALVEPVEEPKVTVKVDNPEKNVAPPAPQLPSVASEPMPVNSLLTSVVSEPVSVNSHPIPAGSEPVVSEPAVTGPVVTGPAVTEPAVSEPAVSEPAVSEPAISEPTVSEPVVSEPVVSEPVVSEPAPVTSQPSPAVQLPATAVQPTLPPTPPPLSPTVQPPISPTTQPPPQPVTTTNGHNTPPPTTAVNGDSQPPSVTTITTSHQAPLATVANESTQANPTTTTADQTQAVAPVIQGPLNFMEELHFYANLPPAQQAPPEPQPPLPKPHRETAARTIIELRSFEPDFKPRDKDAYMHHLCGWPATPPKKPSPAKKTTCAVTGQPARYCDPVTGLPYLDSSALKVLRRLMGAGFQWSPLLGSYCGPVYNEGDKNAGTARPAVGVPAGFYNKKKARADKAVKMEMLKQKEKEKEKETASPKVETEALPPVA
jgi:vacuolar protein sorting-associated protein 72